MAEVDHTNAPKNKNITMSFQNIEGLYKMKTGPDGYIKFPCPRRKNENQTLIDCLNSTHFYPKPLNCLET